MKFLPVLPTEFLAENNSDTYSVQAHGILTDYIYSSFFKDKPDDTIVLNNSSYFLGASIDTKTLLETCEYIRAKFIICPDVKGDYELNLSSIMTFYAKFESFCFVYPVTPIPVLHGDTFGELMQSILFIKELGLKTIAIPAYINNIITRPELITHLQDYGDFEYYMLGFYSREEYLKLNNIHNVLAMESTIPITAGFNSQAVTSVTCDTVLEPIEDYLNYEGPLTNLMRYNLNVM